VLEWFGFNQPNNMNLQRIGSKPGILSDIPQQIFVVEYRRPKVARKDGLDSTYFTPHASPQPELRVLRPGNKPTGVVFHHGLTVTHELFEIQAYRKSAG